MSYTLNYYRDACQRSLATIRRLLQILPPEKIVQRATNEKSVQAGIKFFKEVLTVLDQADKYLPTAFPDDLKQLRSPLHDLELKITIINMKAGAGLYFKESDYPDDIPLSHFFSEERAMMPDLQTITAAITAATAGIKLFDKIADQIDRFITKSPEPAIPKEHRFKIEKEGNAIVSKYDGQEHQRITAEDLQKLPEFELRHINVLAQSMENHYSIWASVYPQLALATDPISKAKTEQQLKNIIREMKGDFEGILRFLEQLGLQLDDHYSHIRAVIART